jgi:hypothetical protein
MAGRVVVLDLVMIQSMCTDGKENDDVIFSRWENC